MMTENKEVAIVAEAKRFIECLGTKVIGFACQDGRATLSLSLIYGGQQELACYAPATSMGSDGKAIEIILSWSCLGIHAFHVEGDEFAEQGEGVGAHLHVVVSRICHNGTKWRTVSVLGNEGVAPTV